jgi:hypothetical protein
MKRRLDSKSKKDIKTIKYQKIAMKMKKKKILKMIWLLIIINKVPIKWSLHKTNQPRASRIFLACIPQPLTIYSILREIGWP